MSHDQNRILQPQFQESLTTDWLPAVDHFSNVTGEEDQFTDCCACIMPLRDLDVKVIDGGFAGFAFKYRCQSGKGCAENPRRKRGADLRFRSHYPA